jgi:glyoxylase-like metal-dependent hydrolase (beta-lactamase superfamily II)
MNYSVKAFNAGTFWVPGPEVYWMERWGTREEMNIIIYLVRGGGHNILINTGPPQDLTVLNKAWVDFFGFPEAQIVRTDEQLPQNILRSQGLAPEEITKVLVTPLQAYATANIHLFQNAEICISRKGWIEDFQLRTIICTYPGTFASLEVNHYLQNEGWEKFACSRRADILPGLRAFWAGVHHRSSLAVSMDTSGDGRDYRLIFQIRQPDKADIWV